MTSCGKGSIPGLSWLVPRRTSFPDATLLTGGLGALNTPTPQLCVFNVKFFQQMKSLLEKVSIGAEQSERTALHGCVNLYGFLYDAMQFPAVFLFPADIPEPQQSSILKLKLVQNGPTIIGHQRLPITPAHLRLL